MGLARAGNVTNSVEGAMVHFDVLRAGAGIVLPGLKFRVNSHYGGSVVWVSAPDYSPPPQYNYTPPDRTRDRYHGHVTELMGHVTSLIPCKDSSST